MSDPAKHPIELALWAPYNEVVEISADFTGWQTQSMSKGTDGWWRYTVPLADGDYLYRFRVKSLSYFCKGEMKWVFDPYAIEITADADENAKLKVRKGKRVWTEYQWKHDDVPLPPNADLVIYELHVGDFAGRKEKNGTFKDVIARMDYLKDLGINCIELMPVKYFPGRSWGYSLRSLFAVDPGYGTPDDLCALVDEAHARAIRVVIDGVYNHTDTEAPFTKIDYAYWYYEKNPDPPELQWGPKYDYKKFDEKLKVYPARKYVIESIEFWVEKFHIDGIRFDATRAIKDFDVMKELSDAAFNKLGGRKPFFTVAEHVPEDPAITGYPKGPMVAEWYFSLAAHLRALLVGKEIDGQKPEDLDGLFKQMNPATNGHESGQRYVHYLVSHDQDRIMQQLGDKGHVFDDAAFRRVKLGLTLLATTPGLPMIWMGQEFGFASEKTLDPRPLDWSLLQQERNAGLHAHYRAMLKLRLETPALRTDSFEVVFCDQGRRIFAFKRWNDEGNVVLVIVNLKDAHGGEVVVKNPSLEDGDWHEHVNNFDVHVQDGQLKDQIGESEVKVYLKK